MRMGRRATDSRDVTERPRPRIRSYTSRHQLSAMPRTVLFPMIPACGFLSLVPQGWWDVRVAELVNEFGDNEQVSLRGQGFVLVQLA